MKLAKLALTAGMLASLTGCAAALPMEYSGILYRDTTYPLVATQQGPGAKVGRATMTSILGLITTGNAGIEAAKRAGGITRVAHVDIHATQTLGIIASYTVIVYGD
jgi:hypothetical protein